MRLWKSGMGIFVPYSCGDLGLTPNAGRQAPLEAAARHERRLEAVACTPLFGRVTPQDTSAGTGSLACRVRYASTSSCIQTTAAR